MVDNTVQGEGEERTAQGNDKNTNRNANIPIRMEAVNHRKSLTADIIMYSVQDNHAKRKGERLVQRRREREREQGQSRNKQRWNMRSERTCHQQRCEHVVGPEHGVFSQTTLQTHNRHTGDSYLLGDGI